MVEQAEGVGGQVVAGEYGALTRAAGEGLGPASGAVTLPRARRGPADVAVVEADHVVAAARPASRRTRGPRTSSGRQPHDQQQRLVVGVAEGLVAQLHPRRHRGEQLARRRGRTGRARSRDGGGGPALTYSPYPKATRRNAARDRMGDARQRARSYRRSSWPPTASPTSSSRRGTPRPARRRCCARPAWSPRPAGSPGRGSATRCRAPRRTPVTASSRDVDPVVLVPGFLAGDASLALMARVAARAAATAPTARTSAPTSAAPLQAADQLEARIESVVGAPRPPGADRRPQPGRHARPRAGRTPSRPGLGHRHPGQPDARPGRPPRAP